CRTSAQWTTIHRPDARTSHLRTLSKILDFGLSASSVPRRTKVPEGAAHHTANFRAVNTSPRPFLPPSPPSVLSLRTSRSAGRALCTATLRLGRGNEKKIKLTAASALIAGAWPQLRKRT